MSRPRIFVSGPYRAETEEKIKANIITAHLVASALWAAGWAVFCPHLNTAHFDGLADEQDFLDYDLWQVGQHDAIYMLPKWTKSKGSCAERAEARRLEKPEAHTLEEAKELLDRLTS